MGSTRRVNKLLEGKPARRRKNEEVKVNGYS